MAGIVREWRQRELLAQVSGRVVAGMDQACQFAVEQARSKAPVRRGIMRDDIAYRVEARGNAVTGYVGVKRGKAFYARFVELGTRRMPARPFLRPAVYDNADTITRLIAGG